MKRRKASFTNARATIIPSRMWRFPLPVTGEETNRISMMSGLRHQHCVDNVYHAIGLVNVGNGHCRYLTLGIGECHFPAGILHSELFALNGLELLAVGEIGRIHFA